MQNSMEFHRILMIFTMVITMFKRILREVLKFSEVASGFERTSAKTLLKNRRKICPAIIATVTGISQPAGGRDFDVEA